MQLEVLLFAAARDAAGCDRMQVDVLEPVFAGDVLDAIGTQLPRLSGLLPACRLAVDCHYVTRETPIVDAGCEIALIPPVSGG
jgi:molybdopterin synthase catalytic subunit/molybdopterin synthase sulfur carrier subunit